MSIIPVRLPLEVSIPFRNLLNTNNIIKATRIEIDGRYLEMEFYVLDMRDFDIILVMDWLSKNHATILCFEKEVVFQK